ncbi:hypothetical protein L202_04861 [Cryptococcus amylolentus CBS 6039]|uniref:Opsin n=1 Tax=Cryptococcus amylolentus CBS 6039 TaxID=1295533 RepID=A0A1E3HMZ6_9TREE|nr:hypothetical protein L202_04861 [Cryptococcus amylolentus CBS 6039]ODN77719.1 hypothetical protein L202_04861 [Cryptococcus amylolentus CBS 6039]
MDYLADFVPTSTISVNPPGGTHTHHPHHSHLPVPTDVFPSATPRLLHATHKGHVAAWVFTAVFAAGLAASVFLVSRTPKKNRLFHGISSVILLVSTLSYLSLATHIGAGKFVPIYHPPGHSEPLVHLFRQIFTIRYIDAAITLPLILLTLSRLSGVSPATTLTVVIAQLVNVYAAWAGSVAGGWPWSKHGNGAGTKWAWFAIAALAYFAIWSVLFAQGRRAAVHRLRSTQGLFYLLSAHVFVYVLFSYHIYYSADYWKASLLVSVSSGSSPRASTSSVSMPSSSPMAFSTLPTRSASPTSFCSCTRPMRKALGRSLTGGRKTPKMRVKTDEASMALSLVLVKSKNGSSELLALNHEIEQASKKKDHDVRKKKRCNQSYEEKDAVRVIMQMETFGS